MSVIALGLNHTTAPLDVRGRFAFALDQIPLALQSLSQRVRRSQAPEAALLSTCNRTELYLAAGPDQANLVQPALDWLASHGQVSASDLGPHTYVMEGRLAARHAFRVAA